MKKDSQMISLFIISYNLIEKTLYCSFFCMELQSVNCNFYGDFSLTLGASTFSNFVNKQQLEGSPIHVTLRLCYARCVTRDCNGFQHLECKRA